MLRGDTWKAFTYLQMLVPKATLLSSILGSVDWRVQILTMLFESLFIVFYSRPGTVKIKWFTQIKNLSKYADAYETCKIWLIILKNSTWYCIIKIHGSFIVLTQWGLREMTGILQPIIYASLSILPLEISYKWCTIPCKSIAFLLEK